MRSWAVVAAILFTLLECSPSRKDSNGDASSRSSLTGGNVDVGGYRLSYVCRGKGNPVVVLEAGLGAGGTNAWATFMPLLDDVSTRVCTYDRAGTGTSEARPKRLGAPSAALQAKELHRLLIRAEIQPPYVLVPHSYGGLVARVFADRYRDELAGLVFEDVSTAWEIDLWPKWDDSPWIDGEQKVDIQTTEQQVLAAAPLGDLPAAVVSQDTYEEEGIPPWAAPIFAKQQARLAALGENVIHLRADGVGHFIHDERPDVVVTAIRAVVTAVRGDGSLPPCPKVFEPSQGTCLS
jgi:pimeloyl-ACP methyl ester carboxylesterase